MTGRCVRCGSYAINPDSNGRQPDVDLDLCDTCYWRKRAESARLLVIEEIAMKQNHHPACKCVLCVALAELGKKVKN